MIICKIMKVLVIASMMSCISYVAFAEEGSFNLGGVFVYRDMIEGPYFDEWHLNGNLDNLTGLKLIREGKSGAFEASVSIDCKSRTLEVKKPGLIYSHMKLSLEETKNYITKEIMDSVINKMCPE